MQFTLISFLVACLILSGCRSGENKVVALDIPFTDSSYRPSAWEVTNKELKRKIAELKEAGAVYGPVTGYGGGKSYAYSIYEWLKENATTNELVTLTNDSNSVIKAYAFMALEELKYPGLLKIFKQHLSDTTMVTYFSGCIGGSEAINMFYFRTANSWFNKHEQFYYGYLINKNRDETGYNFSTIDYF